MDGALECSDCKIFACGKKLVHAKNLSVSKQITYKRVHEKCQKAFNVNAALLFV